MKILHKVPLQAAIIFVLLSILSFMSVSPFSEVSNKNFISDLDFVSGASAFCLASIVIILALKNRLLDSVLPLDSIYRLHKYLGIGAAVILCAHVYCHDIVKPVLPFLRDLLDASNDAPVNRIPGIFEIVGRKTAENIGEYLAIAGLVILLATFINRISYKRWLSLHHIFAYLYLLCALHILPLITSDNIISPLGFAFVILTVAGSISAVVIIMHYHNSLGSYKVKKLKSSVTGNMIFLKLDASRLGNISKDDSHFYLLKTQGFNYHPFTGVYDDKEDALEFAIREHGSFTSYLKNNIDKIDEFTLKGPFGAFKARLPDEGHKAVYIANGVGVITFVPFMREIIRSSILKSDISFVFIARDQDDPALGFVNNELEGLKAINIKVKVLYTKYDGRPDDAFFVKALSGADMVYASGSSSMIATIKRASRRACNKGYVLHHEYINFRKLL